MDQPKIERMLRMMLMMSGNINYSRDYREMLIFS